MKHFFSEEQVVREYLARAESPPFPRFSGAGANCFLHRPLLCGKSLKISYNRFC